MAPINTESDLWNLAMRYSFTVVVVLGVLEQLKDKTGMTCVQISGKSTWSPISSGIKCEPSVLKHIGDSRHH